MKPKPSDDAIRQKPGAVQLKCGHWTIAHPVAIYHSFHRKLYDCPQGCGLRKNKGR